MAGKTPYKAVRAFADPIQAALSCFATGKVTYTSTDIGLPGILAFNGNRPTALTGPERPRLTCAMQYQIVDSGDPEKPYKVHTIHYIYHLLTRQETPIVEYHWHPSDTPNVLFPHMHASEFGCK